MTSQKHLFARSFSLTVRNVYLPVLPGAFGILLSSRGGMAK
uniref:Uncharacterized protein n=1 Tax=Anguilla anguilla TaxID=7936 RepID=A0A0E9TWT0_ANGAN